MSDKIQETAEAAKKKIDDTVKEALKKAEEDEKKVVQNTGSSKEKIQHLLDEVVEKVSLAAETTKNKIEEKIPGIKEQTVKLGEALKMEAKLIYDNTLKDSVDNISHKITETAEAAKKKIDEKVKEAKESGKQSVDSTITIIESTVEETKKKIGELLVSVEVLTIRTLEKIVNWEKEQIDKFTQKEISVEKSK